MSFNPPPGWPVPPGWEPPPGWVPDPAWPSAPPGWRFWDDAPQPSRGPAEPEEPWAPSQPPSSELPGARRSVRPIALVAVAAVLFAGLLGGGYALVKHWTSDGQGGPVAGQLRNTFPERPSVGWRLDADTVFDGASFVRPDPTSYSQGVAGFHRSG